MGHSQSCLFASHLRAEYDDINYQPYHQNGSLMDLLESMARNWAYLNTTKCIAINVYHRVWHML